MENRLRHVFGIAAVAGAMALPAGAVTLTSANVEVVKATETASSGVTVFAARELSDFLGQVFGAKVPVVNTPSEGKVSLVLGSNDWSRAAGIDTAALARDEFVIKSAGGKIYIVGRDAPGGEAVLKGRCERATLFGVYEFLYRYAGVRMYFPGELGTIVPKAASLDVPEGEVRMKPSYIVRRYGPKDGTVPPAALAAAGIKNEEEFKRLNKLRQRLETMHIPCCHGQLRSRFYKRFAKTHPEYFVMGKDGKRHPTEALERPLFKNEHLCHTSGVWEEIYQDAKAYLTGQPPEVRKIPSADGKHYVSGPGSAGLYYDIMPHDGLGKCYCPNCQARCDFTKKNYATDLLWSNTVAVARRLKAEGVKGYVTQMAYHPYADVPSFDIPDNVLVMVAQPGPWAPERKPDGSDQDVLVKQWAKKTGGKVWLWTYPDKIFARKCPDIPQMSPKAWGRYFKRLSDWIIGGFGESESDRWIYNYLNYYVFSRVCWDVNVDLDAILDEHYRLMFGAAAPQMKQFFESLEEKWVDKMMRNTFLGPEVALPGHYTMWREIYSPEALAGYAKLFDAAMAAVRPGSVEARRLAMFRSEMLDPLEARAKEAHASFDIKGCLARRAAAVSAKVLFEDRSDAKDRWSRWPKENIVVGRAAEKGPVSTAPLEFKVAKRGTSLSWCNVRLLPGKRYRLSYFVKLDNVMMKNRGGVTCFLKFAVPKGEKREETRVSGTADWVYQESVYETPTSLKAGTGAIHCHFSNACGRVLIDGLRLDEVP